MPPAKPSRREYGTGSITWLSPRRARLRIRVPGETGQRTKVVRVAPKDKGGIGEAKAELERFVAELAVGTPTERTTVTVSEMLEAYLVHCKRVGRTQSTIESLRILRHTRPGGTRVVAAHAAHLSPSGHPLR